MSLLALDFAGWTSSRLTNQQYPASPSFDAAVVAMVVDRLE